MTESCQDPAPEPPRSARYARRDVLRRAGYGGAALLGGSVLGRTLPGAAADDVGADAADAVGGGAADAVGGGATAGGPGGDASSPYGHGVAAPMGLAAEALGAVTVPPPATGGGRELELVVTETQLLVAQDTLVDAWTYGGTTPGPILRVTEGETLRVRLANHTSHAHNLHLHGRHDPAMDGWQPIAPGDTFTYEVTAEPAGVHPYHCHTAPLAEHVARGLYGTLIVDPPRARTDAHEFVLMLCGWDLDGDGRNEVVTWNGVAGFFHDHPITVPVGELVRVYVVNMLEYEPVGSFHLHAQTFDVFSAGTRAEPDGHTDTITLGQGERAVVEFTLPERGRYMFHPHQHHLADKGSMGWFAAV